ncbi:MAG: hypothetical protein KAX19_11770 [Candidatus Brocadiae bacterium]|nr:hypothetical protein [Candidatus Brocadiia bacterium]
MATHIWCILCMDVITDQQTNLVSYINCLERVQTTELPFPLLPCWMGTLWTRNGEASEALQFKIVLVSPKGKKKVVFQSDEITLDKQNTRVNVHLTGQPIEEEGTHYFQIHQKGPKRWKKVAQIPFPVALSEAPDSTD